MAAILNSVVRLKAQNLQLIINMCFVLFLSCSCMKWQNAVEVSNSFVWCLFLFVCLFVFSE